MGHQLLSDANELQMVMARSGYCSVLEGVGPVQTKLEKTKWENSWHCSCRESGWSLMTYQAPTDITLKSVRMRNRLQVPHLCHLQSAQLSCKR